jgi:protein-tyrosine-phosphatase
MAKGLLSGRSGGRVLAFSAGTDPDIDVVPAVVDVMNEVGVSLEQSFPKPYTAEMVLAADLVVTFGEGAAVDSANGTAREHWDVADPRGLALDQVRAIRDDLEARVADLVARLPHAGALT